jgi:hypothetical protein
MSLTDVASVLLRKSAKISGEGIEDLFRRLLPNEGLRIFVPGPDPRPDVGLQGLDASVDATILHRNANAWEDFARLDQRSSIARSSSLSTNSAFGLPVLAMHEWLSLTRWISGAGHEPSGNQ